MRVFISWSGPVSRAIAELLHTYLPCILQDVVPFVSSHDIASGVRWSAQLSRELDQSSFGIICLTPQNIHSDWILFEAGALTKHIEDRACCLLLQSLRPADITGPLAQFQHCAFDQASFSKLLADINTSLEAPLPIGTLEMVLEKWWPDIEANARTAMQNTATRDDARAKRDAADMLEEVLLRIRDMQAKLESRGEEPGVESIAARVFPGDTEIGGDRAFTVTFKRLNPVSREMRVRLDPRVRFQRFLDQMYEHVSDHVSPFTYGLQWIFRDLSTGRVIEHARLQPGVSDPSTVKDSRRLTEVGIVPGSTLEAILTSDLPAA